MSEAGRFRGLFPIVQTPFTAEGEVDFDSLRRLVRHVRGRAEGLTFPGFASEFWRLTEEEILACAEVIVEAASADCRTILNVTAQATQPAVERVRVFEQLGAQTLMVLGPFTVAAPAGATEEHFSAVLGATELPVIVQDSAGLTGTTLDPAMLGRLRMRHGNLAGLKVDQVPTGPTISRYRENEELAGLSYLVGYSGVQMLDAVRRGAEGLMGGCGHLELDRRMVEGLLGGGGYEEFARMSALLNFEMQTLDMVIAIHKQLLYEGGVIATPLSRKPCRGLDAVHKEELRLHLGALEPVVGIEPTTI